MIELQYRIKDGTWREDISGKALYISVARMISISEALFEQLSIPYNILTSYFARTNGRKLKPRV